MSQTRGHSAATKTVPLTQQFSALDSAILAARAADDKKGDHIKVLDLAGRTSYTDACVLISGTSDRHVAALSDTVVEALRAAGVKPLGVEGREEAAWILMDYGDFVVHVFQPEVREFYDIDGFWADAKRVEWKPA